MMMKVLAIAMLCHAANAAYCASIGDASQVPWDQAPDWQKESAIKGVEFCLANPDAPPSANHDSWMAEKVAAGWVYGETKNPDATPPTHPCIVSFDHLPEQQQFKDVLFKTIVAGCAAEVDERIGNPAYDQDFVAALTQRAETAERELETAQASVEKAEAAVKVAKAKVSQGEKSKSPRKIGVMDKGLSGHALRDEIADADKVEIVLSDGKKEITGIKPLLIEGDVWRDHTLGMMLRDPITIHGPAEGEASFAIDGYGLLIDGKQVAYCKRSDPITVAAGKTASIADDIYF